MERRSKKMSVDYSTLERNLQNLPEGTDIVEVSLNLPEEMNVVFKQGDEEVVFPLSMLQSIVGVIDCGFEEDLPEGHEAVFEWLIKMGIFNENHLVISYGDFVIFASFVSEIIKRNTKYFDKNNRRLFKIKE
jgi:hypothetical protein